MSQEAARKFEKLVKWVAELIVVEKAPGFIIGLSGTDSILALLACDRAYKHLGRKARVMGVHYGTPFPPPDRTVEQVERAVAVSPSYRWFPRVVMPWLQAQAPDATLVVESGIDIHSDHVRWADLYRKAISDTPATDAFDGDNAYWVVGTRNATEDELGTYSNISKAVSLLPLIRLWKSEILEICEWLGVPTLAIEHSRQADCDCGRYDLAAAHIPEIDAILKRGARYDVPELAGMRLRTGREVWNRLEDFVDEQKVLSGFKKKIPYVPPARLTDHERLGRFIKNRMLHLGETFPVWRFPAERVGGESLLEQWGMKRLQRSTDLRDANLPDPDRDQYGVGYAYDDALGESYVELRRAYYLCSFYGENPVTVIIRNNSPWFGWDRLPERAYISFAPIAQSELQALAPESFKPGSKFTPWTDIGTTLEDDPGKLRCVGRAIDQLEIYRVLFHEWLTESREGLSALLGNMQRRVAANLALPIITRQADNRLLGSRQVDQGLIEQLADHLALGGNRAPPFQSGTDVGEVWLASGSNQVLPLDC